MTAPRSGMQDADRCLASDSRPGCTRPLERNAAAHDENDPPHRGQILQRNAVKCHAVTGA